MSDTNLTTTPPGIDTGTPPAGLDRPPEIEEFNQWVLAWYPYNAPPRPIRNATGDIREPGEWMSKPTDPKWKPGDPPRYMSAPLLRVTEAAQLPAAAEAFVKRNKRGEQLPLIVVARSLEDDFKQRAYELLEQDPIPYPASVPPNDQWEYMEYSMRPFGSEWRWAVSFDTHPDNLEKGFEDLQTLGGQVFVPYRGMSGDERKALIEYFRWFVDKQSMNGAPRSKLCPSDEQIKEWRRLNGFTDPTPSAAPPDLGPNPAVQDKLDRLIREYYDRKMKGPNRDWIEARAGIRSLELTEVLKWMTRPNGGTFDVTRGGGRRGDEYVPR